MNRKTIAIVLIVLAVALMGYWAVAGSETYTRQQVSETTVDSLFGTESIVWRDEFRPGLVDMIGPAVGVLFLIAAILYWLEKRRKRNA